MEEASLGDYATQGWDQVCVYVERLVVEGGPAGEASLGRLGLRAITVADEVVVLMPGFNFVVGEEPSSTSTVFDLPRLEFGDTLDVDRLRGFFSQAGRGSHLFCGQEEGWTITAMGEENGARNL